MTLELASASAMALPEWEPGAHIDVVLSTGQVGKFALCGSLVQTHGWRIAVAGGSEGDQGPDWVQEHAHPGSELRIRGPHNDFPLHPASLYLFVAYGIGIASVLPMIARAEAYGADRTLRYGGRSRSSMPFLSELLGYRERVVVWPEDQYGPPGITGFLGDPDPSMLVYCCGPGELLAAVREHCAAWPLGALQLRESTAWPACPGEEAELTAGSPGIAELDLESASTPRHGRHTQTPRNAQEQRSTGAST
ncbi:ferredoxin reductase [Streptomyces sp. UG1]|uniref:ferredoxin reductase n=1 Tax=Streptomyces sp. UG1 TaxID=3417652 RepID=UPI003CFB9724